VQRLVLFHLRANLYLPTWTDAAIRRFAAEIGDTLEALLHLSRADVTSKRVGRRREAIANLHHLRTRVTEIEQADAARAPCVPKGLGAEIIRRLGIPAGPEIGILRRACEDAVRRGELPNDAEVDVDIDAGGAPALYMMLEGGELDRIAKERFVIGRGKHCDFVINSGKVSREHAVIVRDAGEFFLEDLGSSNGTWFNKQRIKRRKIEDGDEYFICSEKVKFVYR
jgi:hypothetical protein